MLSSNPLILILGIVSAFIFFYLIRIKASKKQTERDNRPQWGKSLIEYRGCLIQAFIISGAIIILNYLLF